MVLCLIVGTLLMLGLAPQSVSAQARPVLAKAYRLFGRSCLNGSTQSGTAFRLEGRPGFLASLHTVNGCSQKQALPTSLASGIPINLKLCRVALAFDVAVLDETCGSSYDLAFPPPQFREETLYVVGYPNGADQFRRPVFLFRHEMGQLARLDGLGLDPGIFGVEGRGVGLSRSTPVIVIGSSVVPGDSGAPLVTKNNEVVGIVGGGRREARSGSLLGISWAIALGSELARAWVRPEQIKSELDLVARKPSNQFFTSALKREVNGIEYVEMPIEETNGTVGLYWIMASEATRREFQECVKAGSCSAGPSIDLRTLEMPALVNRFDEAQQFCGWAGGTVIEQRVWMAAAKLAQADETAPRNGCSLNLKGLPACRDKQGPIEVRTTKPNTAGIYDLLGNVWEWVRALDGRGAVAGGAFNTPYDSVNCNDSDCDKAIRDRARLGTVGVRCMIPPEQWSKELEP